ncbi:MAG: tRNA glutamyl-Q(34) synthetase GluQRS [Acidimicrobiales bacterium]
MADGRFAPSPTASLHLGNLRTALVAWLAARASGSRFLFRSEDMDRVACRAEYESSALRDLALLGLDFDGPIIRQSERAATYAEVINRLIAEERTYPCFCTRREVLAEARDSIAAPHEVQKAAAYSGTCRELDSRGRAEREAAGRSPSLRLRSNGEVFSFSDQIAGLVEGSVDDFVIRRADGMPAYNLAVVIDDAEQGIGEVVRGDDLLETTLRQVALAHLLGNEIPRYLHVPLVFGWDGQRLAKRHGSVTLAEQLAAGRTAPEILGTFAESLGLAEVGERPGLRELVSRFRVEKLPHQPWTLPEDLSGSVTS